MAEAGTIGGFPSACWPVWGRPVVVPPRADTRPGRREGGAGLRLRVG